MANAVPTETQIYQAIDAWHDGAGEDLTLHDFLGWSWAEYAAWVSEPDWWPQRPLSSAAAQFANPRPDGEGKSHD